MTFADIEQARKWLARFFPPSRLVPASSWSRHTGADVYLKLESELPTGSFKIRGALTAVERSEQQGVLSGLVAASTGNHGAAVAYAARQHSLASTIFLPEHPNPVKRQRIVDLGATIVERGHDYDEAREHAARYARERGWYFIEDGRDPNLLPGTGTIGCEILEQLPEADVLVVPVGDTTLIRGLAAAAKHLRPQVRIVGVQAERAPAYYHSWQRGQVVTAEACDTIADGLAVRCAIESNVRELHALIDDMRLVRDEEMLRAVYCLLLHEHVVAEPAGAAAAAACLQMRSEFAGSRLVALVTGCNITPAILQAAVDVGRRG